MSEYTTSRDLPRAARRALCVVLVTLALLVLAAGLAQGAPRRVTTYDQYAMLNTRHAGQIWADNALASQWAWTPQDSTTSHISWGEPANWPPDNHERFVRVGDWLLLEGFGNNAGVFAPQVVTRETIGDVNCANQRTLPVDPARRQHYVRWDIPTSPYCLQAWGYIDYLGTRVDFYHRQVWFPPSAPGACRNAYFTGQTCIKQWEIWRDNNGNPGGPLIERHRRDNVLAKGIGPGFILHDYRTGWHADLRHHWDW